MKDRITPRQRAILSYIKDYSDSHLYPPTVREITSGCRISSLSVTAYNLHKLHNRKLLNHTPHTAPGISLTPQAYQELDYRN